MINVNVQGVVQRAYEYEQKSTGLMVQQLQLGVTGALLNFGITVDQREALQKVEGSIIDAVGIMTYQENRFGVKADFTLVRFDAVKVKS